MFKRNDGVWWLENDEVNDGCLNVGFERVVLFLLRNFGGWVW